MHQEISIVPSIQLFRHKFHNLWACEAIDLVCRIFEAPFTILYYQGMVFSLETFNDDWENYEGLLAREVRVRFYGGPHGILTVDGTLLTLFLDHLFYAQSQGKRTQVQKALGYLGR